MTNAAATIPIMAPFENDPALPSSLEGSKVGDGDNVVDVVVVAVGVSSPDQSVVPIKLDVGDVVGYVSSCVVGPS